MAQACCVSRLEKSHSDSVRLENPNRTLTVRNYFPSPAPIFPLSLTLSLSLSLSHTSRSLVFSLKLQFCFTYTCYSALEVMRILGRRLFCEPLQACARPLQGELTGISPRLGEALTRTHWDLNHHYWSPLFICLFPLKTWRVGDIALARACLRVCVFVGWCRCVCIHSLRAVLRDGAEAGFFSVFYTSLLVRTTVTSL